VANDSAWRRLSLDAAHDRASELIGLQSAANGKRTDRLFVVLLVLQWLGALLVGYWIAPEDAPLFAFGSTLWWAWIAATLTSGVPLLAMWRWPRATLTRLLIAISQMIWSGLLIEFAGGRTGAYFPLFATLAILACYRDSRVLLTATTFAVAAVFWRGDLWLFGSHESLREWERLVFVLLEVASLLLIIRLSARETWLAAISQVRLEESNRRLDVEFRERTRGYRQYTEQLERAHYELHAQAKELEQARAEADRANTAKSSLVATVSHEIRTPMTAIVGYADVLLANLTDAESAKAARTIKRNGEFLLQLVDDILDLSKLEAGKLTVDPCWCSPRQIVADVVQLLQVRADAKGLSLSGDIDADALTTVYSDPQRLRQILLNLVGNSIKFSSHGDVRIRVRGAAIAGRPALRIDVCDQGIGLTPRQIENVFSQFSQAELSTSRLYGGSGLGLWISRRLANLLGGEITVESAPGHGSTFTLTVTAEQPETQSWFESGSTRRDVQVAPQTPSVDLTNRRILLADDSPDNQDLVEFVLNKAGAQVVIVGNGADAVKRALAARQEGKVFDVVLMDVQMPLVDGFTATAQLRAEGYTGPIVALTAHAQAEQLQQALQCGCDACLSKPIDESLLGLLSKLTRPGVQSAELAVQHLPADWML
jgi:signal transduction histidine kinase/CheY-like chemotaxis protein